MALPLYDLINNINKQLKNICCKIEQGGGGGGSSTNIYNSDGTLTGNRALTGGNSNLLFNGLNLFEVQNTNQIWLTTFGSNIRYKLENNIADGITLSGFNLSNSNSTIFKLSDSLINTRYNNSEIGLKLDFANNVYQLSRDIGIYIDWNTGITDIGDKLANWGQGATLSVDASQSIIKTFYGTNIDKGIKLDFQSDIYEFGRLTGGNTKTFAINDAAAFGFQFSGTGITQATTGANSGQYLKVKVGGIDYVIELKNPS
jgi:hypothetical protein